MKGMEGLDSLDRIAETYVRLGLSLGLHDEHYVDAYYGPPEWREESEAARLSLPQIRREAEAAVSNLAAVPGGDDERRRHLDRHLRALVGRVDVVSGVRMPFDEESQLLYGATAPRHPESHYTRLLEELEDLLPGDGELHERYEAFTSGFLVPPDKVASAVETATEECRRRTLEHIALPDGEGVELAYVREKPWGGQNWYQGDSRSLIEINVDLPLQIHRVLDLASHEGYPGHHVFSAVIERDLVRGRGWQEFTLFALFSPSALAGEGTAMLAPDVAMTADERLAYERDVLFPLAGLDPSGAERLTRVRGVVERLGNAANEGARAYLDGDLDRDATVRWLRTYGLMTQQRATHRLGFVEEYRSYVINYSIGLDLARTHLEADPRDDRWATFEDMLRHPGILFDGSPAADPT